MLMEIQEFQLHQLEKDRHSRRLTLVKESQGEENANKKQLKVEKIAPGWMFLAVFWS